MGKDNLRVVRLGKAVRKDGRVDLFRELDDQLVGERTAAFEAKQMGRVKTVTLLDRLDTLVYGLMDAGPGEEWTCLQRRAVRLACGFEVVAVIIDWLNGVSVDFDYACASEPSAAVRYVEKMHPGLYDCTDNLDVVLEEATTDLEDEGELWVRMWARVRDE